jgi:hypothetical protein
MLAVCFSIMNASLVMSGCSGQTVQQRQGIAGVFEGFVFVGEFASTANLPPHGTSGIALPAQLVPGNKYVFHHALPFSSTDFANEVARPKLSDLGFSVTQLLGIVEFTSGGPLWRLRFSRGLCQGELAHEVDQQLIKSRWPWNRKWEPADYVLTLSGDCK